MNAKSYGYLHYFIFCFMRNKQQSKTERIIYEYYNYVSIEIIKICYQSMLSIDAKSKEWTEIVRISKEESMLMRKLAPEVKITIVNRASSHKKYFADETRECFAALNKIRGKHDVRR